MKKIISIISIISITWLLASCSKGENKYQTDNSSIFANSNDSEITLTEDSSTISGENKSYYTSSNVSQKPENSNNSVFKNNSTSTKPSANNSTPEEPSVDKGPINVGYNPNLTWEEAYVHNGDGTFQLTFVDGQVYTYVPHPNEEGKYLRKGSTGMGQTLELVKLVWDCQWCKYCGSCDPLHHRYLIDITCYDCGEMAKAHTCHICGEN